MGSSLRQRNPSLRNEKAYDRDPMQTNWYDSLTFQRAGRDAHSADRRAGCAGQHRCGSRIRSRSKGLFSTRAPRRPNAIGLSVVRLISIDGPRLQILDVDVLDGTPLLDIKPYVPAFDAFPDAKVGWLEGRDAGVRGKQSDERFVDK